jgi:ABC-2 type transport system ATP-binding protein
LSEHAIHISNIKKSFGTVEAVRSVTININRGELFGLIGPDGAGKTTLFRTICTLLKPDEGQILVSGKNIATEVSAVRKILGYMPQRFSLYPDLTVEQNLRFFAEIFNVTESEHKKRLDQLYGFSKLKPFKNRKAGALSGGMKQKLALSCALIHTPEILVLDEPTFGVDPVSREEFWEILAEIQREGTTIFVSTAYMEEAELCDRIAFMHLGEVINRGQPDQIIDEFFYPLYKIKGNFVRELEKFFKNLPLVHSIQLFGDAVHITFLKNPEISDWQEWQNKTRGNLKNWQRQRPSIEDVFLESIKKVQK